MCKPVLSNMTASGKVLEVYFLLDSAIPLLGVPRKKLSQEHKEALASVVVQHRW